jgi:hypothetical protein
MVVVCRFPYLIWLRVLGELVIVLACTHAKQDTGQSRISFFLRQEHNSMTSTPQAINDQSPAKVSIFARLVPVLSYLVPLAGAALSVLLIVRTFQAMRNAETAGIAAVGTGISEANLPVLIGLYFAIFLGVIGIIVIVVRCFMSTTTASPSAWFFLVAGALGLIPLVLLWEAESLLIKAISPGYSGDISMMASTIQLYLTLTLITAATFALILLVASLVPLPFVLRAKRRYAPLVILGLMEAVLIGMAFAFQIRTSWFHKVGITEHF